MGLATLKGQTVLVIGGTSGIGYSVAKLSLLNEAAHVIVASSSQTKVDESVISLKAIAAEAGFGGRVSGKAVDGRNIKETEAFVSGLGEIDHLVYTSGDSLKMVNLDDLDLEATKSAFDVRYWGAFAATKSAKIKKGGSVTLSIGSVIRQPRKGWSLVAGIAGAVDSSVRGLAVELAPIRVNVIAPGIVDTPLWDGMSKEQLVPFFAEWSKKLLVGHVATPDEVAEAYLFTMKCQYITGQRIEVDGGQVLA